jgi:hypothetical protein
MYADPRDRPIGLKPAQPTAGVGFFGPLQQVYGPKYGTLADSVVNTILARNPFADFAHDLLTKLFDVLERFSPSLGTTNANIAQASAQTASTVLTNEVAVLIGQLADAMVNWQT